MTTTHENKSLTAVLEENAERESRLRHIETLAAHLVSGLAPSILTALASQTEMVDLARHCVGLARAIIVINRDTGDET